MTVKELSQTVKRLISEYDYFDESAFIAAANTALGTVFSELEATARASIYLSCPEILRHIPYLRHSAEKTESVLLCGKAYSMRAFGKGTVRITDGKSTVTHDFNGWGTVIRGIMANESTAEFSGSTAYTIKDITLFSELEGDELESIPVLGEKRSVAINEFIDDFSRALAYPTDENGMPLKNVTIEGDRIICPKSFSGEIRFSYKKRPPRITYDVPELEIPVLPEAEAPLTLLTAAYLLGESESDAAEFFLKEYKRSISCTYGKGSSTSGAYYDTTGWA